MQDDFTVVKGRIGGKRVAVYTADRPQCRAITTRGQRCKHHGYFDGECARHATKRARGRR